MAEKIHLGIIDEVEKLEIEKIYKKRIALENLIRVLPDAEKREKEESSSNNNLYERLVNDMGNTLFEMQNWWKRISSSNNWIYDEKDRWGVDFSTNEVFIQKSS